MIEINVTILLISIVLMIAYLVMAFSQKLTRKEQQQKLVLNDIIIFICAVLVLIYGVSGTFGLFFLWLFNSSLWIITHYINVKHLKKLDNDEDGGGKEKRKTNIN